MPSRPKILAACALLALSVPLSAAGDAVIKSRIDAYRELGAAFKAVNDGLRGSEVQRVLVTQSARQIRNMARAQYQLFPAGSGPQAGVKTKARPEIWSKPKQFRSAQDGFAKAAEAFQLASAKGDIAMLRAEAKKLGATCQSCHTQFRTRTD